MYYGEANQRFALQVPANGLLVRRQSKNNQAQAMVTSLLR